MHLTQFRILATLGGLLAGAAVLGRAQSAQITGLVTDSSEAVIVDADLATINENTGVRHKAKTNEAGYYTLPLLQPGKYRLTVQAQGFKPVTRTDIVLETGKVVRIDFVLEVGQVTETVTVSGAPPLLDTESAGVGQFVESKTVLDMPLDGRRIEQWSPQPERPYSSGGPGSRLPEVVVAGRTGWSTAEPHRRP